MRKSVCGVFFLYKIGDKNLENMLKKIEPEITSSKN